MTSLGRKVEVLLKEISDKYQYIHIGDLPSVRSKLAILEADGVDKTHIVTDFDMTLTKYWKNGERSMSSHGVVENSSVLPPSVRDGMRKLYAKYYPIEIDKHIPFPEKVQAMVEWWTHAHDLLINDAHLLRSTIAEMVLENPVSFRDGIGAFLKMTQEITMPVLVFSAGLADLIDEILTSSGYSPPNLTIVSNEMSFDEGGKLIGFKDPLIHTFNKNEATASDLHTSKIAGRDHVV